MKKIIFVLGIFMIVFTGKAQTYQWSKRISGISTQVSSFEVTVTDMIASLDGASYVSGKFSGTVDFDPSSMTINRTAQGTDGFIARYHSDGSLDWVRTTNLAGNEEIAALSFFNNAVQSVNFMTAVVKIETNSFLIETLERSSGDLVNNTSVFSTTGTLDIKEMNKSGYLVGGYTGTFTLGTTTLVSNGQSDGFCIRFTSTTSSYAVFAAASYGGAGNDIVNCIYDKYLGGSFTNAIELAGNRISAGDKDGFFFKFNTSTLQPESSTTTRTIGGTGDDEVLSIIDSYIIGSGNYAIAIAGYFTGTVNFAISGGTSNLVANGGKDGFVAAYEYNSNNNTYSGNGYNKLGTAYEDQITKLSITDAMSAIYFCGTYGNASGGSEAIIGSRERTSPGAINGAYFGRFTPSNASGTVTPKALEFLGSNIFYAGDFTEQTDFNITTASVNNLAANNGGTNVFIQRSSFCNQSGTTTITGDGFICLGESTTLKVTGVINGNLTWNWYTGGCTNTLIGSGTQITVTPSINGANGYFVVAEGGCVPKGQCASYYVQATETSNAVTVSGNSITAVATGPFYNYQWINCTNGNIAIAGATSQSYTPTVPGSYAVRITNASGCQVTSTCTQMTLALENLTPLSCSLYPNPASYSFSLTATSEISTVVIFNMLGQKVQEYLRETDIYDISSLRPGYYMVHITTENGVSTEKFVKI